MDLPAGESHVGFICPEQALVFLSRVTPEAHVQKGKPEAGEEEWTRLESRGPCCPPDRREQRTAAAPRDSGASCPWPLRGPSHTPLWAEQSWACSRVDTSLFLWALPRSRSRAVPGQDIQGGGPGQSVMATPKQPMGRHHLGPTLLARPIPRPPSPSALTQAAGQHDTSRHH